LKKPAHWSQLSRALFPANTIPLRGWRCADWIDMRRPIFQTPWQ
jgi:hypothetical protein